MQKKILYVIIHYVKLLWRFINPKIVHMKKQLLFLTALITTIIGYSQTFTDNFITYQVISSQPPYTVQATNYDFTNGSPTVTIPATVSNNSITYTVTVIGDQAFLGNTTTGAQLTSVTIPNSVTFIGYRAFQSNLLTSVTIPDSVTQLSNLSFAENPQLSSVTLSANLTDIAQFAFVSCALTTINIPSSVTAIGSNAFANNQLTSVTIPSNVNSVSTRAFFGNPLSCVISESTTPPSIDTPTGPNVSSDSFGNRSNINLTIPSNTASAYANATWTGFNSVAEGLTGAFIVDNITYLVISSSNVRTGGYNTAGGTDVVIPATVTRGCVTYDVTEVAFFSQKNLTSVIIPSSVTTILQSAFANNPNLVSAPLHNGIVNIGSSAFNNCGLTSVNIPTSMASVNTAVFAINDITSVTIPSNITLIAPGAFSNNANLTSVQLHNGITSIGQSAFSGCALTSVNIPTGMSTLENFTFAFNDITSVTIPDNITTIGNSVFTANDITNLTLSNNVTSIGNQAFVSNQLTSVTIPASVTNIGIGAFSGNPFTDVYSEAIIPPTITTDTGGTGQDSFALDRSTIHLHIPTGTTGAYVTDMGALWTGFNPVTEDALLSTYDFELENNIKIISTSNQIEVKHSKNITLENYVIYNISGAKAMDGHKSIISTATLSNGIYILELKFDEGKVIKKFIK